MAQATEKLTFIIEAEDRAKATLKGIEANVTSMGDKIKSNMASIAGISATAGVAFAGVLSVAKNSLEAFAEAEAKTAVSTKILENSISNMSGSQLETVKAQLGGTTDALGGLKGAMDQAGKSAVQLAFDDEEASASFAKLFQATGSVTQANDLLSGSMDLARKKGIDLESASKIMTLALAGNTKELKAMNIDVDENATGLQNVAKIMKSNAGIAEEYANTTAGAMERMKIQTDNLNESLGGALAPAFKAVREAIQPVITAIADFVEKYPQLSGAIIIIVGGLTGLIAIVGALAIAMTALSAVSLPIVGIILAIVVAVGAIIAIFLYWDEITKFLGDVIKSVFEGIKEAIFGAFSYIQDSLTNIWNAIQEVITAVQRAFQVVFTAIKNVTIAVFDFIKNYFTVWGLATRFITVENMQAIYSVIVDVWTRLKAFFVDIWNGIKSTFQSAIDYLNSLIDSLTNKISNMMNAVKNVGVSIGSGVSSAFNSVAGVFKRATGGSVTPNTPYTVGENGAELFVPNGYGSILNQNQLSGLGGGGINITITGNSFLGSENVAETIGDQLVKILKLSTKL